MVKITPLYNSRIDMGMTQQEAADFLGVTRVTYSRWETGVTNIPPHKRRRVAEKMGVTVQDLSPPEPHSATNLPPPMAATSATPAEKSAHPVFRSADDFKTWNSVARQAFLSEKAKEHGVSESQYQSFLGLRIQDPADAKRVLRFMRYLHKIVQNGWMADIVADIPDVQNYGYKGDHSDPRSAALAKAVEEWYYARAAENTPAVEKPDLI